MWRDECGFKHNGPSPYEQRKLAEFRLRMTIEEKYKEKVEKACKWLNNFLYADLNTCVHTNFLFLLSPECPAIRKPNSF